MEDEMKHDHDNVEKGFKAHVLATNEAPPLVAVEEQEIWSLFMTIQHAFTYKGVNRLVEVPADFLQYLGACSWAALMYDKGQKIQWKSKDSEYDALTRLWKGFFKAVLLSIRRKQHCWIEGQCFLGTMKIPGWLTDAACDITLYPDLK